VAGRVFRELDRRLVHFNTPRKNTGIAMASAV
jgi:hypothetical protein